MSKSDAKLYEIDTSIASGTGFGKPTFADDKPVNAFDYETARGRPFMLGADFAGEDDVRVITNVDGPENSAKIYPIENQSTLRLLTHAKCRNSLNVWFNLNFDAQILLKGMPKQNIRQLQISNSTEWKGTHPDTGTDFHYKVSYYPKKKLTIRDVIGEHTYTHFDIAQFTYNDLEGASEDWLGIEDAKDTPSVDPASDEWDESLINMDSDEPTEIVGAIKENWPEIKEYVKKDVVLTREITETIIDTAENKVEPRIPFGMPISTGYVAADFEREHLDDKPMFGLQPIQSVAWDAYTGGRFEVFERGSFGQVVGPDINSAYPAVMSELPNPHALNWIEIEAFDNPLEAIADAELSFVRFRGTTDADRRIQPFAVKNVDRNRVEFPALDDAETTTIGPIFEFAIDAGYLTDYEILGGYIGIKPVDDPDDPVKQDTVDYPFGVGGIDLKSLYAKRKSLEAEGKDKQGKLLKIVMNSLYGKTCQTTLQREAYMPGDDVIVFDPDDYDSDELTNLGDEYDDGPGDTIIPSEDEDYVAEREPDIISLRDWIRPTMTMYDEFDVFEKQTAGKLFNPVLASYITGMTRLELHKTVVEADIEDDVIMFATDSIMVRKDAYEGSELERLTELEPERPEDKLGGWDFDYEGSRAIVVGSGIYEVDRTDKDEIKTAARGFRELLSDDSTLRDAIEASESDSTLPVETSRPVTIGDAIHKNEPIAEVGSFFDSSRNLSADMDDKRAWPSSVDWDDLLAGNQVSRPKIYDGDSHRKP